MSQRKGSSGNRILLPFCSLLGLFLVGCGGRMAPPEIVNQPRVPSYQPPRPSPRSTWTPPKVEAPTPRTGLAGKTIVVDPGHGGRDPGAGEAGFSPVPEKTLNLDIAQKVASLLEDKGARVIMTRKTDVFVELDDRAAMAERYDADLLVSIHADSHNDSSVQGPSIYVARSASWQSRRTANSIHSAFRSAGIDSRGVREADFRVLVKHSKPSVLVEGGYLTNAGEARNLNNNWYRGKIAKCIVTGIENALR